MMWLQGRGNMLLSPDPIVSVNSLSIPFPLLIDDAPVGFFILKIRRISCQI